MKAIPALMLLAFAALLQSPAIRAGEYATPEDAVAGYAIFALGALLYAPVTGRDRKSSRLEHQSRANTQAPAVLYARRMSTKMKQTSGCLSSCPFSSCD